MIKRYKQKNHKISSRVRSKIHSTSKKPRLTVFRSNKAIYAQLIDDTSGKTLFAACEKGKLPASQNVGQKIAAGAEKLGIKEAIFDRGAYRYHGRVKAVAQSARDNGLKI